MNIERNIRIEKQGSPKGFDIAFAPCDQEGRAGNLNQFVLKEMEIDSREGLPNAKELTRGFAMTESPENNCSVIFIVTVSTKDYKSLLKRNFSNALNYYRKNWDYKRIWIPLMGVGLEKIEIIESFNIIYEAINDLIEEGFRPGEIVISVPENTDSGTLERMYNSVYSGETISFENNIQFDKKAQQSGVIEDDDKNDEEIVNFLNQGRSFFGVEYLWGDIDQMDRFINERIWESDQIEVNKNAVDGVKVGDILFGKFTFSGYLRIKAFGVVTNNPNNGLKLNVNWYKINQIDIPGLGGVTERAIDRIQNGDETIILTELFKSLPNLFGIISELDNLTYIPKVTKTGLDNDGAYTTEDLLEIENDVRSFALILASKNIKPPIAVALFGKWGSGKSFFMEHLSKRVSELSINQGFLEEGETSTEQEKNKEEAFCKGIVQIKFNAWSYLDANLWAGLVSTIFEKLNEYITESTKSGVAKLKVQGKLGERLKAFHALKVTEEGKKKQLEILKQGYKKEAEKLENNIIQNIGQVILEVSETDETLKKAYNGLFLHSEKFGENFTIRGTNLVSEYKYWANFIQNIKKVPQLLYYLILAIIGIGVAISLIYFAQLDFSLIWKLPLFSALLKTGFWRIMKQLKVKKYVNQFNALIEKNSNIKDKVTKLEEDIKFVDDQKKEAQEKIEDLENEIQKIQYDLTNDITGAAIRDFINERAELKDYKNHLGIVSIIRKDFETLSELFLESNVSDEEAQSKDNIGKTKKEILVEDRGFIKDQFIEGKKLERIILYIDDLDRCSDEKVLEVIQAVHLLMAFPLFNVVVGVDKRCVNNALIYKNLLQYSKFTTLENIEKVGIHVISPSEYLEKIFQIPFQLDDPSDDDIKGMVDVFLKNQVEKEVTVEKETPVSEEISDDTEQESTSEEETLDTSKSKAVQKLVAENITSGIPEIGKPELTASKKKTITITPTDLELTKDEIKLLREIIWLVGSIPRTVKRYLNIYRIIRAHQDIKINPAENRKEFLTIMFLLAISIGEYKEHAPKILKIIKLNKNKSLLDCLSVYKELDEIKEKIESIELIKELLQYKGDQFEKHISLVGRFSFANIEYNNNIVEKEMNTK